MTSHLKTYPDALRQLFVRASVDEVNAVFHRAAEEIQKNYQMPGFRKGKVPIDMIEKQNLPELSQIAERIFTNDAMKVIEEKGIKLFGTPRFNPMSGLSRDREFTFAIVFEEAPTLKNAPDFSKTTFNYEECVLEDSFVQTIACKQAGLIETVSSSVEDGDIVQITILNKDYTGEKPEAAFDSSKLSQLIGKKAGDKVSLEFDDLGGYLPEFLGRATSPLQIEIKEVSRAKKWDKISDSDIEGKTPFKTKEEYFNATKSQLENMADQINNSRKTDALAKEIGSKVSLEVPKGLWLNNLRDLAVKTAENDIIRAEVNLSDLDQNKDVISKFSNLPIESRNGIAFVFWLDDVAQQENISLEGPELDYYLYRYAQQENMSMADFQKRLSAQDKHSIQLEAIREKAVAHVIKKFTFKATSTVSFAEVWKKGR
ncbi:MAG: trigger factor [Brevinema sp.]